MLQQFITNLYQRDVCGRGFSGHYRSFINTSVLSRGVVGR